MEASRPLEELRPPTHPEPDGDGKSGDSGYGEVPYGGEKNRRMTTTTTTFGLLKHSGGDTPWDVEVNANYDSLDGRGRLRPNEA